MMDPFYACEGGTGLWVREVPKVAGTVASVRTGVATWAGAKGPPGLLLDGGLVIPASPCQTGKKRSVA